MKGRGRLALIAIMILVVCLWLPFLRTWVLPALTALLAFGGVRELHRMAGHLNIEFSFVVTAAVCVVIVLLGTIPIEVFPRVLLLCMMLGMIGFFVVQMHRYGIPGALPASAASIFCMVYIAVPMALSLQVLRMDRLFLLFGLFLIWMADSGAYFAGRLLGKHQFAPNLSPKKTWEGIAGGFVTCVVGAALFTWIVPHLAFPYSTKACMVIAAIISIVAPAGDLAESVLKRDSGVKDSGRGMGGHGGVLDRIDSMLFCMPIYYAFLVHL
jgi:phosphatidate cytidylyltransferase